MAGRGVEVDADGVHAGVDDLGQARLERVGRDVVLVLSDAEAPRLRLHELGQRVLEAAGDADGSPHRDVEVAQLLARGLARAVDARPRLAHEDDGHGEALGNEGLAREDLRLARPGAVADSYRLYRRLASERHERRLRLRLLLVRLQAQDVALHEAALRVHRRELAAGADTGIEAEHR